ncbi:sodium-independent sulfate anion transporter-like [Bacillus rossius redtenbacheri]|uniref:sodium-independent sulfate anion transporter-like n=1 Tax=Bacillus rossius redtenbacheri TaxID=93214 RepID=UPI002FDDF2F6
MVLDVADGARRALTAQWLRKKLFQRLPLLAWLAAYSLEDAVSDLVAGVTVGLTLIPQAIAYGILAGMGPQYGLYSAFVGSLVYVVFGTCKEVVVGPTAMLSLIVLNYTRAFNTDMAILLCFLTGCVEMLCGLLHLGILVEFLSAPVVAGFTSSAALIIGSLQLKGILGLKFESETLLDIWTNIARRIGDTKLHDLALGASCVVVLLLMRALKDVNLSGKMPVSRQKLLKKILWFVSVGRNAMVVFACSAIAYYLQTIGMKPFALTGHIDGGLPQVLVPPFRTTVGNTTLEFLDMCSELGSSIFMVPLISLLTNVAIAKAFTTGKVLDATQEMITLGLCNVVGSFMQSMPVTGAISRSAVSHASGVRTTIAGIYTGVMVILALNLLTPYFYYIPKATLSAVILCAVIFMVEISLMPKLWRANKRDVLPVAVTVLACMTIGVEMGILTGIAVELLFLLYWTARPSVAVEKKRTSSGLEYVLVAPCSNLLFPSVDFLRRAALKGCGDEASTAPVVVSLRHARRADYTAAVGARDVARDGAARGRAVLFVDVAPDVARVLASMGLVIVDGEQELESKLAGLNNPLSGEAKLDMGTANGQAMIPDETVESFLTRL